MAEDDRTFQTSAPAANRAEMQGLGVGRKEMDAQRAPSGQPQAVDPQRRAPFDNETADTGEDRTFADDRNAAGMDGAAELGEGTPANVDIHDLGQDDKPEQDWGEDGGEDVTHSANHTRRPVKTEAERGQGAKTRQLNKDIVSRRS
jgi:hypothetical protein